MAGKDLSEVLRRAKALRWQRRYDEAATLFAEVVREAETSQEADHLADALVWLSIVRSLASPSEDTMREVLELQERALAVDVMAHGSEHLRVADTLRNIGRTLTSLGRREAAIERLNRAALIFRAKSACSASAEDTLAQLLALLIEEMNYAAAADVGAELVAVCEQLGDNMRLTMAHLQLGRSLVMVGRMSDAVRHLERALELAGPRIAKGEAQRLQIEVNDWLARARASP
jgi:tetratricopeptide (TPR) repeat protein